MFGGRELKNLELRRRELVLQSSLNRLVIRTELNNLHAALEPAERIAGSIRAIRPWLVFLAPLAGILAAGGFRSKGSRFFRLVSLLRLIQPLLRLWKQFQPRSDETSNGQVPRTEF